MVGQNPIHNNARQLHLQQAQALVSQLRQQYPGLGFPNIQSGEELGAGGMGAVMLGERQGTLQGSEVAVKFMHPGAASDFELVQRFRREAQITAKLDHPSVPPVHDAGVTATGHHYMIMKKIAGETYAKVIQSFLTKHATLANRESQRELEKILGILVKVLEALSYAHSKGIIHRDIKPDNIMVGDNGEVFLMDWGLAKETGRDDLEALKSKAIEHDIGEDGLTNASLGTPGYMPPYQWESTKRVDGRADIYAIGATFYETLTGLLPVSDEQQASQSDTLVQATEKVPKHLMPNGNPMPLYKRTLKEDLPTAQDRNPAVTNELDFIISRAVHPDRDKRYQSVDELLTAIKAYLAGDEIPGYEYSRYEQWIKRAKRKPVELVAALGVSATMLTASILGIIAREYQQSNKLNKAKAREQEQRALTAETEKKLETKNKELERARKEKALYAAQKAKENLRNRREAERLLLKVSLTPRKSSRLSLIDMAMNTFPEGVIYYQAAEKLINDQEWSRATAALEKAIKKDPDDKFNYLLLMHQALMKGKPGFRFTKALDRILKASKDGEENQFTLFAKGVKASAGGDYKKAEDLYSKSIDQGPFAFVYNNRGITRFRLRNPQGALNDFNKAIKLKPRNYDFYINRGNTLKALGDVQAAINNYARAQELNPKDVNCYVNWANIYAVAFTKDKSPTNFSRALELFNQAINEVPNSAFAYLNRGQLFYMAGEMGLKLNNGANPYEYALNDFEKCLSLSPNPQRRSDAERFLNLTKTKLGR